MKKQTTQQFNESRFSTVEKNARDAFVQSANARDAAQTAERLAWKADGNISTIGWFMLVSFALHAVSLCCLAFGGAK